MDKVNRTTIAKRDEAPKLENNESGETPASTSDKLTE
jgi:hypothetical protein